MSQKKRKRKMTKRGRPIKQVNLELLVILRSQKWGLRKIARALSLSPSTISKGIAQIPQYLEEQGYQKEAVERICKECSISPCLKNPEAI
jgi:IS30 family transposase